MAWVDASFGHYEHKVYGLPHPWEREYTRLLRDRYGVRTNPVGTCTFRSDSPIFSRYVEGYNSVSVERINQYFGKDVFRECGMEARTNYLFAELDRLAQGPTVGFIRLP
jgi:hypothetical protein